MTLPVVPGGVETFPAFERNAMRCPSTGRMGVNWPCGPRLDITDTVLPDATFQPSKFPVSKPPFFSSVITMSPTLVTPAGTGAKLPDFPVKMFPSMLAVAATEMFPWTVGTPLIEKVPSAWVVADRENVVTVAPARGARSEEHTSELQSRVDISYA